MRTTWSQKRHHPHSTSPLPSSIPRNKAPNRISTKTTHRTYSKDRQCPVERAETTQKKMIVWHIRHKDRGSCSFRKDNIKIMWIGRGTDSLARKNSPNFNSNKTKCIFKRKWLPSKKTWRATSWPTAGIPNKNQSTLRSETWEKMWWRLHLERKLKYSFRSFFITRMFWESARSRKRLNLCERRNRRRPNLPPIDWPLL